MKGGGVARQLFLLSQTPLVVQVNFFSGSEHFFTRAEVNFKKLGYSTPPMSMSTEYRLHSELYSFWANDIFKSTVTATEYCSVLTHNKRHEVQHTI